MISAERLSASQLILCRISPGVCMFVCVYVSCLRNAINMRLQCYEAQQLLHTPHTPGEVSAYMPRACSYGHRCSNRMNNDDRVRHLATLRQREKDCSDSKGSMNFNFGRRQVSINLLTGYCFFTIEFHMPLSHSLFT